MSKKIFFRNLIIFVALVFVYQIFTDQELTDDFKNPELYDVEYTFPKEVNTLVLLIEFNDVSLTSTTEQWYDHLFQSDNSITHYYLENSYDLLNVVAANDQVYKVTIDKPHPNYNSESQLESLDEYYDAALEKIDSSFDFSNYDNNDDDFISSDELAIIFVMAGYEETGESQEYLTSGAFAENSSITLDGVELAHVIIIGELTIEQDINILTTVGVFCHEFGHALGLPDLYDTDYSSQGLGIHELMAAGSDNRNLDEYYGEKPAPLSAWSKEFLGITNPIEINQNGSYTLERRFSSNNVYKIETEDGYYLLEYVTFDGYGSGLFEYIANEGLAIWKVNPGMLSVDDFYYNEVNANEYRYGVALIEASGEDDLLNEEFDYWRYDYDHYFSLDGINKITLENGSTITITSQSSESIEFEYKIN